MFSKTIFTRKYEILYLKITLKCLYWGWNIVKYHVQDGGRETLSLQFCLKIIKLLTTAVLTPCWEDDRCRVFTSWSSQEFWVVNWVDIIPAPPSKETDKQQKLLSQVSLDQPVITQLWSSSFSGQNIKHQETREAGKVSFNSTSRHSGLTVFHASFVLKISN